MMLKKTQHENFSMIQTIPIYIKLQKLDKKEI